MCNLQKKLKAEIQNPILFDIAIPPIIFQKCLISIRDVVTKGEVESFHYTSMARAWV